MMKARGRPSARGGLAQLIGHQQQHVLGGAHDDRDDDDGERDRAGDAGEVSHRPHHDLVDEQAHDDRGRAEQDVVDEADDGGQPAVAAVFGHVGAGQDADRRADRHTQARHDQAADDGVEQAAVGARRRRHLGEDARARGRSKPLPEQGAEDQRQPAEAEHRGGPGQAIIMTVASRGGRRRVRRSQLGHGAIRSGVQGAAACSAPRRAR